MRLLSSKISASLGILSGILVSNLIRADDNVCEHPVDHNLFEEGQEVSMSITATQDNNHGYLKIEFADDAGIYGGITATGWCIDLGRVIGKGDYEVDSYSSYDSASIPQDAVDKPENLDLINWLVNEYSLGDTVDPPHNDCPPTELTWKEMQKSIWTIIDTGVVPNVDGVVQCVVDHMVSEAYEKGEDFEPCCADEEEMAVVLISDNDEGEITHQVIVVEIELEQVANACQEYNGGGGKDRPTPAPTQAPTAGVVGDPHFKTWTGEMYDFHGVCDLVLLQNPGFKNGLGMDIHIRTKKAFQWSYISNVAIDIGNYESVEIMGTGKETKYWINGVEGDNLTSDEMYLPDSISGFQIHYRKVNSQQKEFVIDLKNRGERIVIAAWKNKMIRVDIVNGTEENFGGSLGLLGTFGEDSKKMARDNSTIIEDIMKFGQEWQVQVSEEKLFHNLEGPQAPSHCDIPSRTTIRRRLGQSDISKEAAELACSKIKNTEEFNLCVFDVMVSSDIALAGVY